MNLRRLAGWVRRTLGRTQGREAADAGNAGTLVFDQPFYSDITQARITHLRSLGLSLRGKSVMDLGCGIGRFAEVFLEQGCDLFCVDGREGNIAAMKTLYPEVRSALVNLEGDEIRQYGSFDVVFCYGLLYHLADPLAFLRTVAPQCREMLLLETCVMDAASPIAQLVFEDAANASQSVIGVGSRPSPSYVALALKLAGFTHVYVPRSPPKHREFEYQEKNDLSHIKNGQLIRSVFVATYQPLNLPALRELS